MNRLHSLFKTIRYLFSLSLLATGMCLLLPCSAQAVIHPPIRVGYDISGSMLYKDNEGTYRGYNMEYLYEISKYTGWNYELIPFNKWADAVKALENGRIDILPTMLKSPDRQGKVLFSDRRMGMVHVALVVPEDSRQHFYGVWDSLQGTRIGVRENTVDSSDFFAWAKQQNLHYTKIEYADRQDLTQALDQGKIDAAALSYIGTAKKYRAIAEFAAQDMYFAVTPAHPELLNALNAAMGQIAIMNPQFYSNLMTKYLETNTVGKPVFSKEEQAFIDSGHPIRVTLIRKAAPFSSWQDGRFSGIIPDILHQIEKISGLTFTFVPVDSQEEAVQYVHDGKADMLGRLANNVFFARKCGLRLTTPYAYMPMMQIKHKATKSIQKIGVQGMGQLDQIMTSKQYSGNMDMKVFPDVQQCFNALTSGAVDAIYCDQVTANYFMNTHRYSEYQIDLLQPFTYDLTFGIYQSAPSALPSILDKSIRCITTAEIDEIIMQNRIQEPLTLENLLERLPVQYLTGFILVLLLILFFFAYASLNLWRKRDIEKRMNIVRERNQQVEADLAIAKKVNTIKDQFFTHIEETMHHPLEQIAQLAQQTTDSAPENLKALQEISVKSQTLQKKMQELLLLDHLERGKIQLHWKTVNSLSFFRQIASDIRTQAEKKGLVFRMDLSNLEERNILMDERYTQDIFQRLLENAVKFTNPGGTVTFIAESFLSPRGRFVIWSVIKDTGIGMHREFLENAYTAFSQEKRLQNTEGTGTGLAIVHGLIHLMEGEIEIRSRENKGTEIRLELYFDSAREKETNEY